MQEGSVDISWLPDPDKKREESSDGEEEEGQEQGEEGGREWESGGDSEDEEAMEREFGGRRGGRAVCGRLELYFNQSRQSEVLRVGCIETRCLIGRSVHILLQFADISIHKYQS